MTTNRERDRDGRENRSHEAPIDRSRVSSDEADV